MKTATPRMNGEAGQLLTAEQLADRWQIKSSTVYALTRKGSIPTVRLGRLYRYRLSAVEDYERAGGGEAT
jgi:excisionase family DNA binding protein